VGKGHLKMAERDVGQNVNKKNQKLKIIEF
jgi:hypothetical protein